MYIYHYVQIKYGMSKSIAFLLFIPNVFLFAHGWMPAYETLLL